MKEQMKPPETHNLIADLVLYAERYADINDEPQGGDCRETIRKTEAWLEFGAATLDPCELIADLAEYVQRYADVNGEPANGDCRRVLERAEAVTGKLPEKKREYLFDVQLDASISICGSREEVVRRALRAELECASANLGEILGQTIVCEVSLNGAPVLAMIDGKEPPAGKLPRYTRLSSEHGFDDYDVEGIPTVHRVTIGNGIRKGDIFNVYCDGSRKIGGVWQGTLEKSLEHLAARLAREEAKEQKVPENRLSNNPYLNGAVRRLQDGLACYTEEAPEYAPLKQALDALSELVADRAPTSEVNGHDGVDWTVRVEMSVTADSPEKAAEFALDDLRDPTLEAINLDVENLDSGRIETVSVKNAPVQSPSSGV